MSALIATYFTGREDLQQPTESQIIGIWIGNLHSYL